LIFLVILQRVAVQHERFEGFDDSVLCVVHSGDDVSVLGLKGQEFFLKYAEISSALAGRKSSRKNFPKMS
jgi:hypothetical protein